MSTVLEEKEMKNHRRVLVGSLASAALMSLFLVNNGSVKADEVVQPNQVQQSGQVKVTTNQDNAKKPNNDQWANPANYKNDIPVQVLGINDLHGNIDTTGKAYVGRGMHYNAGNAARLSSYLNNAENDFKDENPEGNTFRVEAGDMVGASPATSSLLQDEPTMKSLKAMDVNIGTLGNHEFDEGLGEFYRIVEGKAPKTGQFNQEEQNYPHENSNLQIVISNVVNKKDQTVPFNWQPYLTKEVKAGDKSSKVGFIGVVTADMPKLTFAKNLKDYQILDPAETIAKYDHILQNQGVNVIVVLAHTGVSTYKGKTSGEAVDILKKLYKIDPNNSVDLYVAAHSHQYANGTVGRTKIVQANKFSMAYDDAIGYIDPQTNDFVNGSLVTHVYPVMSPKEDKLTKADPKVEAIIKDAENRTSKITNSVIGKTTPGTEISASLNDNKENAVGDLVVDAQLFEAKKKGIQADFAITNGGGVRSNLNIESDGSIKWKSAQAVQPFNNQIQVFNLTGKQIYDVLNSQYVKDGERYYLVSGMRYAYTDTDDPSHPQKVAVMLDGNGKQIDLNKTYRVITSNYLVDSTAEFKGAKKVADVGIDTDLFVDYFKDQTAAGKLILAPELNRKFYLTKPQFAELLNKLKQEAQASKQNTVNNKLDEKNSQPANKTDKLVNRVDETKVSEPERSKKTAAAAKVVYVIYKAKKDENTLKVVNESVGKSSSLAMFTRGKNFNRNESKKASLPKTGTENVSWISWLGLALTSLVSVFGLGIKKRK